MNLGPTVFGQIFAGLNRMELARAATQFPMPRASRALSVHDHFAAMVFAQLTYRESLRDIEACLQSRSARAYHMGISGRVTRTNLGLCQRAPRLARVRRDCLSADASGQADVCGHPL